LGSVVRGPWFVVSGQWSVVWTQCLPNLGVWIKPAIAAVLATIFAFSIYVLRYKYPL
jgi:uncharacterized membrane protein